MRPFELPLLKILNEPTLPSDLAFRAAILRLGNLPNLDGNTLAIEVPLSGAEIREDPSTNLYSAHLSILAQIKDNTGAVLESFSEDIPRRGALEEVDHAKSESVLLQRHFIAPPGDYVLESAVLDSNSGNAGAKRVNFKIPEAASGPSLSDLVVVQRMEPFDANTDPLEPLLQGNDKIIPNLSGLTPRNAKGVSVFFVTHPDPHVNEAASLRIELLKNGEPLNNSPQEPRKLDGAAPTTHLVKFPVSSLPAGTYQAKATITQGGQSAESVASFTLATGPVDEAENEADAPGPPVPAIEARATGPLAITFPATLTAPPPAEELKSILADATQRAVGYSSTLPNFICIEVTSRSVDPRGQGKWKHIDRFTELLTYRDNTENRTMLETNGLKTSKARETMDGWISHGEFGGVLKIVFQPSSKAEFKWNGTGTLGEDTVQVFDYRVARENSEFDVSVNNLLRATVGFHGQVFVDSATRSVRRITLQADNLPQKLPVRATSMSVDYDYILINNHDYLLPIGGQVSLIQGRRQAVLNELEFRGYRHFGSTARILPAPLPDKP
jgi:hypothetical protein